MKYLNLDNKLFIILILGFLLGLGNPWFDYPLAFSVGDEFESQKVALEIFSSRSLRQASPYFPLWAWLQMPFIGIHVLLLLALKIFPNLYSLQQHLILTAPGMFLYIPRILSALLSAGSLWWLYCIGKLIDSRRLGLLMALIYSVDFLRVQQAHFGRNTSLYICICLGLLYWSIHWYTYRRSQAFYWSFSLLSLAIAAYPMGITFIPLVFALFLLIFEGKLLMTSTKPLLWIGINSLCLGLLMYLTPGIINSYRSQVDVETTLSLIEKSWYYLKVLISYQGMIFLLGIAGIIRMFKNNSVVSGVILAFSCLGFLPFLIKGTVEPRYILTLTFAIVIGAAYEINQLYLTRKPVGYALLTIAISYSLLIDGRLSYLFFQTSTYVQAKQWIEVNIPQSAPTLIYGNNIYMLPTLSSQQPKELYDIDYYHTINPYLKRLTKTESNAIPNLKTVRTTNNLEYFQKEKSQSKYFKADNYEYVVLDYFTYKQRQQLIDKFQLDETTKTMVKKITANNRGDDVPTLLNIDNPFIQLFAIERFGPNFEIYSK